MWLWKDTAANWYHHNPDPVCHTEKYKLSCDFKIQLDHYIEHNKSDIVLLNKEDKSCIMNSYSSKTRRIWADIYNQRGRRPSWLLSAHIRQVREE